MDDNIPEEIQEKLEIIEKEMYFSQRMKPPSKALLFGGAIFLLMAIVNFIDNINYYESALFLLVAGINIICYFDYRNLYKIHSNARDIINYYRNREAKN
jgi:hypothetical protein